MPESLRIALAQNRTNYQPGDEIIGRAEWSLDASPSEASVHLCWFTRGKGTVDTEIVGVANFQSPTANDQRTFSFRAPEQPYSFSGQLISLVWAVELVVGPGDVCERVELTIAPDGKEIELASLTPAEKAPSLPAAHVI